MVEVLTERRSVTGMFVVIPNERQVVKRKKMMAKRQNKKESSALNDLELPCRQMNISRTVV